MQILHNVPLKDYTSFYSGGNADKIILCEDSVELQRVIADADLKEDLHVLGYGTNVLISDDGLRGTTITTRGGNIRIQKNTIDVDAGIWWDEIVQLAEKNNLWGVELMNGIPSSIGGAIMGNIAAYGQQVSDTLVSVEVVNTETKSTIILSASDIGFSYRYCTLREHPELIITRATFRLSDSQSTDLTYVSALRVAEQFNYPTDTIVGRRQIIIEARSQAGSLYNPSSEHNSFTAGSFFKNPIVSVETAKKVMSFDETNKSLDALLQQNQVHGGDNHRVSAAHVLLAAGFERGQTWGQVRLHPEHILKIENMGNATSQQIYDVAQTIITTVQEKLAISLEPEVQFIGNFK